MTATQVFLRFIKSQYTNNDGTINPKMFAAWRKELHNNHISSILKPDTKRSRIRKSKDFVDDYLYKNRYTLSGFISHFLHHRYNYRFGYVYGYYVTEEEKRIKKRWKLFLLNHIKGETKKYWIEGRKFDFEWIE